MAEEGEGQVTRVFEQPPDAISFYSDWAQIIGTGHEILMQFYETIPGPPTGGAITLVKTRLRVTIAISQAHAANIGRLLMQRVGGEGLVPPTSGAGQPGTPS